MPPPVQHLGKVTGTVFGEVKLYRNNITIVELYWSGIGRVQ
jgi:hypothetical protein